MNSRPDISAARPVTTRAIYLDHHATTPVDRRVAKKMLEVMTETFGNPRDRGHVFGQEAFRLMEGSRATVASFFNADPDGVAFAASATDAADRLLRSLSAERLLRVAATTVEHGGLIDVLERLRRDGRCTVDWLEVDSKGRLDLGRVAQALQSGCDLLVVMAANNEVGTLYPTLEISRLAVSFGVPLLVDASQAAAHIPFDVFDAGVTYLLASAHKMYGPKGVAAIVSGTDGGPFFKRLENEAAGTPDVAAIVGFAEACRLCAAEMPSAPTRLATLRDRLEDILVGCVAGLVVNGDAANRLPHNLHVSIPDVPNDAVVAALSRSVALSTGSACQSGTDEPSHVLSAMGLSPCIVDGALRMGLGRGTTPDDIENAGRLICAAVESLRITRRGGND